MTQTQNVEDMFDITVIYHDLLKKSGQKLNKKTTKILLIRLQFLGLVKKDDIQPEKVRDLKASKSQENKRNVMRMVFGILCYIYKEFKCRFKAFL